MLVHAWSLRYGWKLVRVAQPATGLHLAPGVCSPKMNAVAPCCTTHRRNTHGTEQRELLYPWHPWAERQVFIHEVIEKGDASVFHCSISGQALDRWLEVPGWMFDRVPSASWRITTAPHVDLAALGALATLLRTRVPQIAIAGDRGSIGLSRRESGSVHAAPAYDIPVRSVLEADDAETV